MRGDRTDDNHAAVIEGFREAGYSATSLAPLKSGVGDALVGAEGRNFLFEIKDPAKKPSARVQTKKELKFAQGWKGQYHVIYTAKEGIEIIRRHLDGV